MALTSLVFTSDAYAGRVPAEAPPTTSYGVYKQLIPPTSGEPTGQRVFATWSFAQLGFWTWHRGVVNADGTVTDYATDIEDEAVNFMDDFYNLLPPNGWFATCDGNDYTAFVDFLSGA